MWVYVCSCECMYVIADVGVCMWVISMCSIQGVCVCVFMRVNICNISSACEHVYLFKWMNVCMCFYLGMWILCNRSVLIACVPHKIKLLLIKSTSPVIVWTLVEQNLLGHQNIKLHRISFQLIATANIYPLIRPMHSTIWLYRKWTQLVDIKNNYNY